MILFPLISNAKLRLIVLYNIVWYSYSTKDVKAYFESQEKHDWCICDCQSRLPNLKPEISISTFIALWTKLLPMKLVIVIVFFFIKNDLPFLPLLPRFYCMIQIAICPLWDLSSHTAQLHSQIFPTFCPSSESFSWLHLLQSLHLCIWTPGSHRNWKETFYFS